MGPDPNALRSVVPGSSPQTFDLFKNMATPAQFERATPRLGIDCYLPEILAFVTQNTLRMLEFWPKVALNRVHEGLRNFRGITLCPVDPE